MIVLLFRLCQWLKSIWWYSPYHSPWLKFRQTRISFRGKYLLSTGSLVWFESWLFCCRVVEMVPGARLSVYDIRESSATEEEAGGGVVKRQSPQ